MLKPKLALKLPLVMPKLVLSPAPGRKPPKAGLARPGAAELEMDAAPIARPIDAVLLEEAAADRVEGGPHGDLLGRQRPAARQTTARTGKKADRMRRPSPLALPRPQARPYCIGFVGRRMSMVCGRGGARIAGCTASESASRRPHGSVPHGDSLPHHCKSLHVLVFSFFSKPARIAGCFAPAGYLNRMVPCPHDSRGGTWPWTPGGRPNACSVSAWIR